MVETSQVHKGDATMYGILLERLNKVFWRWYYAGRSADAVNLLRAWQEWWARRCQVFPRHIGEITIVPK